VKIIPVIDGLRGSNLSGAYSLGPALYEAIGRIAPAPTGDMPMIRTLFREAEWWEVYDLCEALVRQSRFPEATVTAIEALFAAENLPYAMTEDGIVWRFSAPASEGVAEATRLLIDDPALRAPAQQWQKALAHLSERPPDTENCIKDAVGAVEGAARILSGRKTETLSSLITPFGKQIDMHPTLVGLTQKLYAYRGDEQAVAHGATQAAKDLSAEAELVLHLSAALIVYLAKKRESAE
jgi:hypothetical protein